MKTICKYGHTRNQENLYKSGNCKICIFKSRKKYQNSETYKKHKRSIEYRFLISKLIAKKRELQFSLTLNEYKNLISNLCYYCGDVTLGKAQGIGLDRIDNNKGYILNNVLPCCGSCNIHKGIDWTVDEMKSAIRAVKMCRSTVLLGVA